MASAASTGFNDSLLSDLRKFALFVFLGDFLQRDRLDLAGLAFASERQITRLAHQLGGFARRLQIIARIEPAGGFGQVAADGGGHRQTDNRIENYLALA